MADISLCHDEPTGDERDSTSPLETELWDTISAESSVEDLLNWQVEQANRYCAG